MINNLNGGRISIHQMENNCLQTARILLLKNIIIHFNILKSRKHYFPRSVKLNTVQPRHAKCTIIMREKKQAAMRYARKKNYAAYLWNVISTLCIQPSFIKIRCFDHIFNSIKSIPLIINRTNYCDLCTHSLWWLFDLYLRITVSRCERAIFAVRSPFEMEFLQREMCAKEKKSNFYWAIKSQMVGQ